MRTFTAQPVAVVAAATLLLVTGSAVADAVSDSHPAVTPPPWNRLSSAVNVERRLDPLIFFDELVERYRGLTAYSDLTKIVHVTRRFDEQEPKRTETQVACEIADGKLSIITPGMQLRRGFGLQLPLPESPEMQKAKARYDIWLVPHMALKFSEKPLEDLREGVSEGFTATDAASVTIDDRPMVHLELTSGDGLSGDYNARFDLYVDPESMLIERIEGRQRLPDGGDFEATIHITPTLSKGGEPTNPPVHHPLTEGPPETTCGGASPCSTPTCSPPADIPPAASPEHTCPTTTGAARTPIG